MKYEKCFVELDEILKQLKDEDLEKIPYEIRKTIKMKKDKTYNWSYDESKTLKEQNISRMTIAMLSYLNMEYLLNKKQKKIMEEFHRFNENKKYNLNNILKKYIVKKRQHIISRNKKKMV